MGYDYRVATAPTAGSVSPLFSIDAGGLIVSLDEALAMVPSERVILALPWYGRAWSTFSDEPDSATLNQRTYGKSVTVEYGDAMDQARHYGRWYDAVEQSAWTVYPRSPATAARRPGASSGSTTSIMRAKQQLVIDRALRGLGIWALGYDDDLPELWTALRMTLSGAADTEPPSGTAAVDPASGIGRKNGPADGGRLAPAHADGHRREPGVRRGLHADWNRAGPGARTVPWPTA